MRVAVTGASGLIGSALVPALREAGHEVVRLVRRKEDTEPDTVFWDPSREMIDMDDLGTVDAAVHLAGYSVASGRWTRQRKALIMDSRVQGTRTLAQALSAMSPRPATLVSASAVGYYGLATEADESSPKGEGFLADVCEAWEAQTEVAEKTGIRVVHCRFGVVLSQNGGALQKMRLPFSLGLGGKLGDGTQPMSWITRADAVAVLMYLLNEETISGPVNVVAPQTATNAEFTRTLGKALKRPTVLPVPKFALKAALGEMADQMLLGGARVSPTVLQKHGFEWQHPTLEQAFDAVL